MPTPVEFPVESMLMFHFEMVVPKINVSAGKSICRKEVITRHNFEIDFCLIKIALNNKKRNLKTNNQINPHRYSSYGFMLRITKVGGRKVS